MRHLPGVAHADLFEALAGAVLIDSGFSIATVKETFWPHMCSYITQITPETVESDPVE